MRRRKYLIFILFFFNFCMEAKRSLLDISTTEGFALRFLAPLVKIEILKRDYPQIPDKIRFIMKGNLQFQKLYSGNYWFDWQLTPLEESSPTLWFDPIEVTLGCNCYYSNFYEKKEYLISARSIRGHYFEKKITIEISTPLIYLDSPIGSGINGFCPASLVHENKLYLLYLHNNVYTFIRWDGKNGWNIGGSQNPVWTTLQAPPFTNNPFACPELLEWQGNLHAIIYEYLTWSPPTLLIKILFYNKEYNSWGFVQSLTTLIPNTMHIVKSFSTRDYIFITLSNNSQTRYFIFKEQNIHEIQSLNYGTSSFGNFSSIVEIDNKILMSPPHGVSIFELEKQNLTWNLYSVWGGYYGTNRYNFQLLNYKNRLYIGWLEDKPNPNFKDIRLVKYNESNWLDGGNLDSAINYFQENLNSLDFTFLENKIYSLFGNSSNIAKMKVFKNGMWYPIFHNLNRNFSGVGFVFANNLSNSKYDFPILVGIGWSPSKILITGILEE